MFTKKHKRNSYLSIAVLCFLCLFVAAEPVRIVNASLTKASTMACCAGKAGGHCESGIAAKRVPPPKREPMCGLKGAQLEDDGITLIVESAAEPVAESQHSHSQTAESKSSQPAAESASLSRPCHMDCGACASSASRQQKRERSIVHANTHHATPPATTSRYEEKSLLFSSSDSGHRINPRGPPVSR
jgi:hypothetical protein